MSSRVGSRVANIGSRVARRLPSVASRVAKGVRNTLKRFTGTRRRPTGTRRRYHNKANAAAAAAPPSREPRTNVGGPVEPIPDERVNILRKHVTNVYPKLRRTNVGEVQHNF